MRTNLLAGFLAVASTVVLLAPAPAAETAPGAAAGAEYYDVHLVNITTSYGQERWKSNPYFYVGTTTPANFFTNQSARFDEAVGLRVALRVKITNEDGTDVSTLDPNVNLTASIDTTGGPLPAYVQRESSGLSPTGSTSPYFFLVFDLDGSNYAPPGGHRAMALAPGGQVVHVKIFKKASVPTNPNQDAGATDLTFDYDVPTQDVSVSTLTGSFVTLVPDDMFRLVKDIGRDQSVRFVSKGVVPNSAVGVRYRFTAPDATVRWYALGAERMPGTSGTLEVHRRLISIAKTDSTGVVTFNSTGTSLLNAVLPGKGAGLVILAAQLSPEEDLGPVLGPDYQFGSPSIHTGATELVVPISNAQTRVTGFRVIQVNTTNRAPDQFTNLAQQANQLEVSIFDAGGTQTSCGPSCGDSIAILPDLLNRGILARGNISQNQDPGFTDTSRVAQIPAKGIQDAHVTHYRVVNLFYQGNSKEDFYALDYADRGYVLNLGTPSIHVGQTGYIWLNFTSLNTNYDLRADEPTFNLLVATRVTVAEMGIDRGESVVLKEGGVANRSIPVGANRTGDPLIVVRATTGDTLTDNLTDYAHFTPMPPKKNLAGRIPAVGPAGLLSTVALLLFCLRRLRRGEAY